jgi:hypothetical protein
MLFEGGVEEGSCKEGWGSCAKAASGSTKSAVRDAAANLVKDMGKLLSVSRVKGDSGDERQAGYRGRAMIQERM